MIVSLLFSQGNIKLIMSKFYEELCNMIIRPSRQKYQAYDLGNPYYKSIGHRVDFELEVRDKLRIKCSLYRLLANSSSPCIVYLHSLNGSRLQSIRYSEICMENGFNFCSFDFAACGMSEGEYVSLGYHEKYDIMDIINHLHKEFGLNDIVLWGRSMGASCIITYLHLLHTQTDYPFKPNILCCIMDSPFSSLTKLAVEIAQSKISIPVIFIKAVFAIIKNTIENKANFKVDQLQLLDYLPHIKPPVLILTSKEDNLVNSSHSEDIYQHLKSPHKELIFIKGQHHESRDPQSIERVIEFIKKHTKSTNQKRQLYRSISKSKYQHTIPTLKLYLNFTPKLNKPQQSKDTFFNSRHERSDSYNTSPNFRKLNFISVNNPMQNHHHHVDHPIQNHIPIPPPTLNSIENTVEMQQNTNLMFKQIRKSIQYIPQQNHKIDHIIFQDKNNEEKKYNEGLQRPQSKHLYFTQPKSENSTTQMSNQNMNKIMQRLFEEEERKKHSNIINSKLKKRKKEQGNCHQLNGNANDNGDVKKIGEQLSRTMKSSTGYNFKEENDPHLNPKCQILPNCFPSNQIFNEGVSMIRKAQRLYTGEQPTYENGIAKRVKNAISLRNFINENQLRSSKEIKMGCNFSKQRNLHESVASKKFIILKSPKRHQQFGKNQPLHWQ